jgi:hypothetical protein
MRWMLLLSGCLSFHAVQATAKLGDDVARHPQARALDPLGGLCRLSAATGTQRLDECQKLDEDAKVLRKIPVQIGAWSEALRCMAEDRGARSFGGDVAALVGMAGPKPSANVGAAVDALTRLITQSYRRSALQSSVREAAPHIATLIEFARAAVKLEQERVDVLTEQARKISGVLGDGTPPVVAERLALADLQLHLASLREALADYDAALLAFGAAHARLAQGGSDHEVYEAIVSDVKDLAQAVVK